MLNNTSGKKSFSIVLIIGLLVIFFLMEMFFRSCSGPQRVSLRKFSEQEIAPYKIYLQNNYQNPQDYVIGHFIREGRDVLFLGDTYSFKQNVNFVKDLIPLLYENGIYNLGLDCALYRDQGQVDQLLTQKDYNEKGVYKLLFNRFILWGYQEYADLFGAAWLFNQRLAPNQKPFRILALNVKENWQHIQQEKDQNDPAIIQKVYAEGLPDNYIVDVLQKEVIEKHEQALVYVNLQHAMLHYTNKEIEAQYQKLGFTYQGSAARQLYEQIGDRCSSVFFHVPWPGRSNPQQPTHPAEGYFSFLIGELPPGNQVAGFDIKGSPFARIHLVSSFFAESKSEIFLKDLCDGYIIQGPFNLYVPTTPIPDFINPENIEEAKANFPGPKNGTITPEGLNLEIAENVKKLGEMIQLFE
jgi:hypothetical protein